VTEQQHICFVTTIGAVVGAAASYLFFTERGIALRRQILPAFDEFEHELNHFLGTLARTAAIAGEGWKLLNDGFGENAARAARPVNPHQSVPF
jgi:hypothetical protein